MTSSAVAIPAQLQRLDDLACNLWWTWNDDAQALFRDLEPRLWEATNQNGVLFLKTIAPERLDEAANDPDYLRRYESVMTRFDAALTDDSSKTWVGQNAPDLATKPLAYFSAEFGLHRALPIYSGGLGVLAGDHIKEASDIGLPLVAVSLLYRQGYLRQQLTPDGWQQDVTANLTPDAEPTSPVLGPDGSQLIVEVAFDDPNAPLRLAVWQLNVGRVTLYLLDSDVEGNPDWTRATSSRLYGGDLEHRLRQELILGIGGVRALRAVGIDPAYWHCNEGHAAFSLLERLREQIANGLSFAEAKERVQRTTVFTSHTPVPAGHDVFPPYMVDRYFWHFWPRLGLDRDQFLALGEHSATGEGFNLTALSLRLANQRNGVSERHGEITRGMWHDLWPGVEVGEVPITSVTNGVHLPTWISPPVTKLLDTHLGQSWRDRSDDPSVWEPIRDIDDGTFWRTHLDAKLSMLSYLRERSRRRWLSGAFVPEQVVTAGPYLQEDILTIGFARRFATYKRATLIFHDPDRLARILNNPERPVQIVFAGKAHPADDGGKKLIQEIGWRARDPRFGGRIAFAEDYDMGVAAELVAGVDVWLNNPRAPLEASGTSGMKASANGAVNLSILDGWWREAWQADNSNGWGMEPSALDGWEQDAAEANLIYEYLEQHVVPLYYDVADDGLPHGWIAVAKDAIRTVAPQFSSRRMLVDYVNYLYRPAARG